MTDKPTAKILFHVGPDDEETVWAYDRGNHVYLLAYPPFFVYGVSCRDEVIAKPGRKGGGLEFVRIHRKSGNRTVRIAGYKRENRGHIGEQVIKDIEALGCKVHGRSRRYVSVNVPPRTDLQAVARYLVEHNQRWEYADPAFREPEERNPRG
jgi:hypothetical protein